MSVSSPDVKKKTTKPRASKKQAETSPESFVIGDGWRKEVPVSEVPSVVALLFRTAHNYHTISTFVGSIDVFLKDTRNLKIVTKVSKQDFVTSKRYKQFKEVSDANVGIMLNETQTVVKHLQHFIVEYFESLGYSIEEGLECDMAVAKDNSSYVFQFNRA